MTLKVMTRFITLPLVCAFLASCGSQPPAASEKPAASETAGQNTAAPDIGAASETAAGSVDDQLAAYNDIMTLKCYYNMGSSIQPNNYYHDWILEHFKIDLQSVYTAGENYDDKVRTLAAAKQLPDALQTWSRGLFDELAANGLLLPLDDLLNGPSATTWFPAMLRDMLKSPDGKLYILEGYNLPVDNVEYRSVYYGGLAWGQIFTVNQDILAKTGMRNPQTTDEMIAFLRAAVKLTGSDGGKVTGLEFYGCGPADYSNVGYPGGAAGAFTGRNVLMHMMTQLPDSYTMTVDEQNQAMKFNFDFTAYPAYLKLMSQMYRDGLLDKEMFVSTFDQLDAKMMTGNVAMSAFSSNIEASNSALSQKTNLPYAPVDFPRDPSVTSLNAVTASPAGGWYWVVNKDFPNPERLAKFIDWHFSDEGLMFDNYGPPDETKQRNTWWYEAGTAPGGLKLAGKPTLDLALQQQWDTERPNWETTECGAWGANALGLRMSMNYAKPGEFGVCMASDFVKDMDSVNGHDKNVYYVSDLNMVKFDAAPYGDVLKAKGTIVNDLLNKWEVKIISTAASDAEVDSMYRQMMTEAHNAGYQDIAKEAYQIYKQVNPS